MINAPRLNSFKLTVVQSYLFIKGYDKIIPEFEAPKCVYGKRTKICLLKPLITVV